MVAFVAAIVSSVFEFKAIRANVWPWCKSLGMEIQPVARCKNHFASVFAQPLKFEPFGSYCLDEQMGMPRYEVRRSRSRETARIALAVNAISQLFFVAKKGGKGIYMHFNLQSPFFLVIVKIGIWSTQEIESYLMEWTSIHAMLLAKNWRHPGLARKRGRLQ